MSSIEGHVIVSRHVTMLGHVFGHVTLRVQRDHVMHHMVEHMIVSQGHMGKTSSLLFDCSLALGSD